MPSRIPVSRQMLLLAQHLSKLDKRDSDDPTLEPIVQWLKTAPKAAIPEALLVLLAQKYSLTLEALLAQINAQDSMEDFDALVPKKGWLHDYVQYTRQTEPPTAFHFFAGLVSIGAALSRSVHFDMGSYQLFPNICCIIVAPSGKCRKTSACNIAVGLFRNVGGNILADKVTPEALVAAFADKTSATGLIYAPELAVFLGKQKYNEGMVPLLTALFDCPKEWSSLTVMRGEGKLYNVALSFLACSTMDWIQTAIPRDAFGGGFMSRLLFVVQNDTPRCYPIPPPLDKTMENSLKSRLYEYTKIKGKFKITEDAVLWHDKWYRNRTQGMSAEKQFSGYMERKSDHMFRVAMVLAVAELPVGGKETGLVITTEKLEQALSIVNWMEGNLPAAFEQMGQNVIGEIHTIMTRQLKNAGGAMDHSTWLRKNSNRMTSRQFKENVETLKMSRMIDYDGNTKMYYLTPEGWSK